MALTGYPTAASTMPLPAGREREHGRTELDAARATSKSLTRHRATLPALTGIRYFAAVYVVLFHSKLAGFFAKHHLHAVAAFLGNGQLAVLLFFVLSGFILAYTYRGQLAPWEGKKRFFQARFARIWPLYAFSLLLCTLVDHTTPGPFHALLTLFMVQAWSPTDPVLAASWNSVCWTLSTELLFYLLFPWVQLGCERISERGRWVALVLVSAVGVIWATGNISYSDMHGIRDVPLAVAHLPDFFIGTLLGNLFLDAKAHGGLLRRDGPLWLRGGWFTTLMAVLSLFLLAHTGRAYTRWTELSFGFLILGLATEPSPLAALLSTRVLVIGGEISYGVYLLQWPCKTAINRLCERVGINSTNARFVLFFVVLTVLSLATFRLLEEPARKWLRRSFASWDNRTAAHKERPV